MVQVAVGQAVDQGRRRCGVVIAALGDGDGGGRPGHRDRDDVAVGGGGDGVAIDQRDRGAVDAQYLVGAIGEIGHGELQRLDSLAGVGAAEGDAGAVEQRGGSPLLGKGRAGGDDAGDGGRMVAPGQGHHGAVARGDGRGVGAPAIICKAGQGHRAAARRGHGSGIVLVSKAGDQVLQRTGGDATSAAGGDGNGGGTAAVGHRHCVAVGGGGGGTGGGHIDGGAIDSQEFMATILDIADRELQRFEGLADFDGVGGSGAEQLHGGGAAFGEGRARGGGCQGRGIVD